MLSCDERCNLSCALGLGLIGQFRRMNFGTAGTSVSRPTYDSAISTRAPVDGRSNVGNWKPAQYIASLPADRWIKRIPQKIKIVRFLVTFEIPGKGEYVDYSLKRVLTDDFNY